MGTIENVEKSINVGLTGFEHLRRIIANIISEEFGELYEAWCKPYPFNTVSDEEGNERLKGFYESGVLTDNDDEVIEFLFSSFQKGKLSAKGCKRLWHLIRNYNGNDDIFGSKGGPFYVCFNDFKEIVEMSAENNWVITWW